MKTAIALLLFLSAAPSPEWTIDESVPASVVEGEIVSLDDGVLKMAFEVEPEVLAVLAARGDTVVNGRWIREFSSAPEAALDQQDGERIVGRRARITLRRTLSARLLVVELREL